MAADITQETFEVKVADETFVFRIPSPRDYARMGSRALVLRREDAPETTGSEWGMDGITADLYRGFALMETLLTRADTTDNWPYTESKDGKPVVNCNNFPAKKMDTIISIWRGFDAQLARFHGGGDRDGDESGTEGVGG